MLLRFGSALLSIVVPLAALTACSSSGTTGAPSGPGGALGAEAGTGPAPPVCALDVDFATDPANCGACGHSCLGGRCSEGFCGAVTIVSTDEELGNVVVGGGTVFWSLRDERRILGLPLDGGSPAEIDTPPPASDASTARRGVVAADDAWVYWSQEEWVPEGSTGSRLQRTLARTPRAGGAAEPLPNVSTAASTPGPFLARGRALFAYDGGEYGGAVRRLDLDTKESESVLTLSPSYSWSWRDVHGYRGGVVGTTMYGAFVIEDGSRTARTVPLVEPDVGRQPYLVASDGMDVFAVVIASSDNYRLVRARLDGSSPPVETVKDDRSAHPHGLAVDDTWIYLLERLRLPGETTDRDRVTALRKDGGASRVLHEARSGSSSRLGNRLLHDAGSLFVVDAKAVHRIVTPATPR